MSTRCLLCWPFWQFRRLYRKRRPRHLSSSLFLRALATTLTDDVFDFTVHCSPRLKEAPHGEGSEQTMPLLLRILQIELGIRQQQREVLQEVRQLKLEVRLLSMPQHAQPAQPPSDLPRLPAGTIGDVEAAEAAVQSEAVAAALMSSAKKQGATRRRPSTLLRGGCQGLVIAVGAGSGASEKHLLWSSPMIPTLRVQIIGCSRQLASCPATAARALTAPLPLCPQRNLTCSRAGLF
ncbi:uncharacterized protein LOC142769168 isoform X1 [Rhipicephalus microplus]|uniref:uncharacterized protein LOC142769168 isoform X1 n=2 Tax=Rhipicephalus microplus TaxID=6941 RepID=UPI003F6CEEB2